MTNKDRETATIKALLTHDDDDGGSGIRKKNYHRAENGRGAIDLDRVSLERNGSDDDAMLTAESYTISGELLRLEDVSSFERWAFVFIFPRRSKALKSFCPKLAGSSRYQFDQSPG